MSHFAEDLSKLTKEAFCEHRGNGLLAKYGIPIQNLDFDYISKCNNGDELEKILKILLSGEEGYYPELTKATEDRLAVVNPKSKLLRKANPVIKEEDLDKQEVKDINGDLAEWLSEMKNTNDELEHRCSNYIDNTTEIRKIKSKDTESEPKKSEKRITSTDYESWDKYDPDTELLKIELKEEKIKKEVQQKEIEHKKKKKSVRFNNFATEAEAVFASDREREKGNEYFRAQDYEEALLYYTNSIEAKRSVRNLNNRAATYLKLKQYEKALEDCESVLSIEPDNEKAMLRKVQALKYLQRYYEALEVANAVIKINPNNTQGQDLVNKLNQYCPSQQKKSMRMTITEVSSDEDDD